MSNLNEQFDEYYDERCSNYLLKVMSERKHVIHDAILQKTRDYHTSALLSHIIYWFTPDRKANSKLSYIKDNRVWLVKQANDLMTDLCLTRRQFTKAMEYLKSNDLIRVEVHTSPFHAFQKAMFISLNPETCNSFFGEESSFSVTENEEIDDEGHGREVPTSQEVAAPAVAEMAVGASQETTKCTDRTEANVQNVQTQMYKTVVSSISESTDIQYTQSKASIKKNNNHLKNQFESKPKIKFEIGNKKLKNFLPEKKDSEDVSHLIQEFQNVNTYFNFTNPDEIKPLRTLQKVFPLEIIRKKLSLFSVLHTSEHKFFRGVAVTPRNLYKCWDAINEYAMPREHHFRGQTKIKTQEMPEWK